MTFSTLFKYLVPRGESVLSCHLPVVRAEPLNGVLALSLGDAVHDAGDPVSVGRYLGEHTHMISIEGRGKQTCSVIWVILNFLNA